MKQDKNENKLMKRKSKRRYKIRKKRQQRLKQLEKKDCLKCMTKLIRRSRIRSKKKTDWQRN